MRKTISIVLSSILALSLLLFEALLHLALLLRRLWDKWRYTALTLREPPPREGMFGAMARRLAEKRSTERRKNDGRT